MGVRCGELEEELRSAGNLPSFLTREARGFPQVPAKVGGWDKPTSWGRDIKRRSVLLPEDGVGKAVSRWSARDETGGLDLQKRNM